MISTGRTRPTPGGRLARTLAALALIGLAATEAQGARIQQRAALPRVDWEGRSPVRDFLAAGPSHWARYRPDLPEDRVSLPLGPDGTPLSGLFLDYLHYRNGLDPTRIDVESARGADLLASLPAGFSPLGLASPGGDRPRGLVVAAGQTVPEPPTALIALVLVLGAAASRRRRPIPLLGE